MENVSEELQNVFPFAYIYFRGEKFEINQRKIAGINHQIQISYYRNFTLDNMAASIVIFFLSLSFPLTKYCIQFSSAASAVILPSSISPKNKKKERESSVMKIPCRVCIARCAILSYFRIPARSIWPPLTERGASNIIFLLELHFYFIMIIIKLGVLMLKAFPLRGRIIAL